MMVFFENFRTIGALQNILPVLGEKGHVFFF